MFDEVKDSKQKFQEELSELPIDEKAIEDFRIKYLGKKGIIKHYFNQFGKVPNDRKKEFGKLMNSFKQEVTQAVESLEQKLNEKQKKQEFFDYTLPGTRPVEGSIHPLSKTMDDILNIFKDIGFSTELGPEVETDYYNFQALNFPENHPARDTQDTFFVEDDVVLRTHTSPIQVRTMEKQKPPIRILAPGRTFRNEAIDASHYCTFHQIEGLYIDKDVTFSELKTTLYLFVKKYFGEEIDLRFRPSFFPFTEPSAEVDISCFKCGGNGEQCSLCKGSGWLEILGCGMVDPNVLSASDIDPEKYTGYAFGMGIERIAMLKYGIDDIRLLYGSDKRFLKQFKQL
ncbi:MAG: phenylalanine--tRNA ligase subunit alpha [Candidatus Marinimicrobia bacterium]|nr:phenylalanine--tRNA ligase subunit alpha [Candidatus Neomarinimicrobiota bacterium]